MEVLNQVLPIIIYLLLSALIVICIILGIRFINLTKKAEKMVDDVQEKLDSLDGVFNTVDFVSDKLNLLGDSIIIAISNLIKKVFKNKEKEKEME